MRGRNAFGHGTGGTLVVGLTGGIATGKSTVLEMFKSLGAQVLSADEMAREVLRRNTDAYHAVVKLFGPKYVRPDGELDRAALAHLIFSDYTARERLNQITHPVILKRIAEEVGKARAARFSTPMVVEIPLLFEASAQDLVDKVIVVASEHSTQFARLKRRTGWPDEQVEAAIASQMPLSQKISLADWVVWNDGPLQETDQQVRKIWREMQQAAKEDRQ
ncbi:MAG: dephospho-CoA kinase [Armatimonadota bacterium]